MNSIKLSDNDNRNYLASAFFAAIIITICSTFFTGFIPYEAFALWKTKGAPVDWISAGLPIFIWGGGLSAIHAAVTRNDIQVNNDAEKHFVMGALLSILAGVVEEICFRWLIFLSGIALFKISNFLIFDWLFGFGLAKALTVNIFAPMANFATLGYLGDLLTNPTKWSIAASMLAANAFFRDGHKYQGWIGYINSWFMGMFFFWLMFKFGIPSAILVHFLYDFLIDIICYIDRVIERTTYSRSRQIG